MAMKLKFVRASQIVCKFTRHSYFAPLFESNETPFRHRSRLTLLYYDSLPGTVYRTRSLNRKVATGGEPVYHGL
jgi:hypothetical protein